MSRQIRFRSWDLDYNWMEDHFYLHSSGTSYDTPSRTYDTPNIEIDENPNLIVMQFTGLLDKNGKEVYEGDICYVEGLDNCSVRIDPLLGTTFTTSSGVDCSAYDSLAEDDTFEVIGNIYENPELLEEGL
jgi:hypothetical protein